MSGGRWKEPPPSRWNVRPGQVLAPGSRVMLPDDDLPPPCFGVGGTGFFSPGFTGGAVEIPGFAWSPPQPQRRAQVPRPETLIASKNPSHLLRIEMASTRMTRRYWTHTPRDCSPRSETAWPPVKEVPDKRRKNETLGEPYPRIYSGPIGDTTSFLPWTHFLSRECGVLRFSGGKARRPAAGRAGIAVAARPGRPEDPREPPHRPRAGMDDGDPGQLDPRRLRRDRPDRRSITGRRPDLRPPRRTRRRRSGHRPTRAPRACC